MEVPETDSDDEVPPGWEERCTADGLVFYAHHTSRTTQWTHPRTGKRKKVTGDMPYGWERKINDDASIYFVDHLNNKTTFIDPRIAFAVEETQDLKDFRQRFDGSSTGFTVLHGKDLSDRVAIVTGANSGIGLETAKTLLSHGCSVVFACRSLEKANKAISALLKEHSEWKCHSLLLDLASLSSVKSFATEFKNKFKKCDMLILNAGVFGIPHTLTEDGLEATFQINYLSQIYLALLLQPFLSESILGRVVFVASESHRFSTLSRSEDFSLKHLSPTYSNYYPTIAYNNSKLCMVLGAFELHRRFDELGLKCYAVHPGNIVCTNLSRHWWIYRLLFTMVRPFAKSLAQACAPVVFCAISPELQNCGGIYVNNCVPCMPSKAALDPLLSNALWNTSIGIIEKMIGRQAFHL